MDDSDKFQSEHDSKLDYENSDNEDVPHFQGEDTELVLILVRMELMTPQKSQGFPMGMCFIHTCIAFIFRFPSYNFVYYMFCYLSH